MANEFEQELQINLGRTRGRVLEIESRTARAERRITDARARIKTSENRLLRIDIKTTELQSRIRSVGAQLLRTGAVVGVSLLAGELGAASGFGPLASFVGSVASGAAIGGPAGAVLGGITAAVSLIIAQVRSHTAKIRELELEVERERQQLIKDAQQRQQDNREMVTRIDFAINEFRRNLKDTTIEQFINIGKSALEKEAP